VAFLVQGYPVIGGVSGNPAHGRSESRFVGWCVALLKCAFHQHPPQQSVLRRQLLILLLDAPPVTLGDSVSQPAGVVDWLRSSLCRFTLGGAIRFASADAAGAERGRHSDQKFQPAARSRCHVTVIKLCLEKGTATFDAAVQRRPVFELKYRKFIALKL